MVGAPEGSFSHSKKPIWPVVYELIIKEPYLAFEKPAFKMRSLHFAIPSRSEGILKVSD
jgi:hypothetical protein